MPWRWFKSLRNPSSAEPGSSGAADSSKNRSSPPCARTIARTMRRRPPFPRHDPMRLTAWPGDERSSVDASISPVSPCEPTHRNPPTAAWRVVSSTVKRSPGRSSGRRCPPGWGGPGSSSVPGWRSARLSSWAQTKSGVGVSHEPRSRSFTSRGPSGCSRWVSR